MPCHAQERAAWLATEPHLHVKRVSHGGGVVVVVVLDAGSQRSVNSNILAAVIVQDSTSNWTESEKGHECEKNRCRPESKTHGDSGTPKPTMTNNYWPSRAQKNPLRAGLNSDWRSPKMLQMQRKTASKSSLNFVDELICGTSDCLRELLYDHRNVHH